MTTFEAHKFILGLHSDHFNNAFFGSGVNFKEEEDGIVVIKDATKEAFEDFLGFNYEKNIEFEKKTLRELYDILNLAERYQVNSIAQYLFQNPSMNNKDHLVFICIKISGEGTEGRCLWIHSELSSLHRQCGQVSCDCPRVFTL